MHEVFCKALGGSTLAEAWGAYKEFMSCKVGESVSCRLWVKGDRELYSVDRGEPFIVWNYSFSKTCHYY